MSPTIQQRTTRISDQALRGGETGSAEIRSTRRRIDWSRSPDPIFEYPRQLAPYDLTQHGYETGGRPRRGRRVFVVGKPMSASDVQVQSARTATHVYARGQRYPSVRLGHGCTVSYAALWFGESEYSPADAATCWEWLTRALQGDWTDDRTLRLLATPATTGRDLWARTLDRVGFPVMSPEAQGCIRPTAGQGRMQCFPRDGQLRGMHEYDARMAYVALMDELPVGEPLWLPGTELRDLLNEQPYTEGRYDVTWQAPRGWQHPGILAAHDDGPNDWCWPTQGRGWAGGAELLLARREGWDVTFHGGWVWQAKASPLRVWRNRLLRVLKRSEVLPDPHRRMIRFAVRAILLHTIGAFYGSPHWVTEQGEYPPDNARRVRALANGQLTWERPQAAAWPQMVHPEWTVTLWGRARARLMKGHRGATGALTIHPDKLVAFRTDAVYTTEPTGWELHDDGQPGRYVRHDYAFAEPQPWPTYGPELLRLRELS
jgi:hypothetical protein